MKKQKEYTIADVTGLSKEQFNTLYQISQSLNTAVYEDSLIENSLDLIVKVLNAERGLFVKYNAGEKSFSIISARNVKQESITDLSEFSSGILQKVINEKKPVLFHDAQSDPGVSQFESIQLHKIKSIVGVPIFQNGNIWGVCLVDSQLNRNEFTEENLLFLDFFSNMVSLALDKIVKMQVLQDENLILKNRLESTEKAPDLLGESKPMKDLAKLLHRVAATDATVLITGESGSGKDLVARAIHKLSGRKDKPFLAQFCGSIPDTLLESELFGYRKGAFTGAAKDKKGLFEVADKGTFFLDEIADISSALQTKLLRVIENKEIMRLGDTRVKQVNVRIIAATNRDMKKLVEDNSFREDLFYRLNVFPIGIPPLRERGGDIPVLAEHFIKQLSDRDLSISPDAVKKLESYSWPGNVRQLINVLQRAVILCDADTIDESHLILEADSEVDDFRGTLKDFEWLLLKTRLDEFKGDKKLAAESLGVSLRWVQMKLKDKNNDE
jgi:Nif-specific regulatory protein